MLAQSDVASNAGAIRSKSSTSRPACGGQPPTASTTSRKLREAMTSSSIKPVLIHAGTSSTAPPTIPRSATRRETRWSTRCASARRSAPNASVLHPGFAERGHIGEAIERACAVIGEALSASDHCRAQIENTAGAGGTLVGVRRYDAAAVTEDGLSADPAARASARSPAIAIATAPTAPGATPAWGTALGRDFFSKRSDLGSRTSVAPLSASRWQLSSPRRSSRQDCWAVWRTAGGERASR